MPLIRVAQFSSYGPPSVLEVIEIQLGPLEPDHVLVEIRAAGLNPFDVKQRAGAYGNVPLKRPRRTGMDGTGVVVAAGANITKWEPGARVLCHGVVGTSATHLLVRDRNLIRLPSYVPDDAPLIINECKLLLTCENAQFPR